MLSVHLPNVFPQGSKYQNPRATPVKPKAKRKNDDIPCKARRKAKRASDRAKSVEAASSEASAGMVEADPATVSSSDVTAISTPAPLHSTEMVDIATTSVTVASSQLPPVFDPAQLSSAEMVDATIATRFSSTEMADTTLLSFAEKVEVVPPKSSVMKDKPPQLVEKVRTASPLPTSAEKVATTSKVMKCATTTPSTIDTDTNADTGTDNPELKNAQLLQSIRELKPGERWYEYKRRCKEVQVSLARPASFPLPLGQHYEAFRPADWWRAHDIKEGNYEKYKKEYQCGNLSKDFWCD